ncbi:MAG: hypothetical protein QOG49_944 [Frankiaceae bacterium]|nr:hypothetical protein [Frankiaceae bacterium]
MAAVSEPAGRRRRTAAAVAALLLAVGCPIAVPAAAHAAAADLAAALESPALTGAAGDQVALTAYLVNADATAASGPGSLVLALSGSSLVTLDSPDGVCTLPTATCSFDGGLAAGQTVAVFATVQLASTGSVTATAVLSGGDSNPANDSASASITVTAVVPAPPPPTPAPAPAAVVSLTAPPRAVRAGSPVRLTAKVTTAAGAPLANAYVAIMRQYAGAAAFTSAGTLVTDAQGVGTFDDEATGLATYHATYAGDSYGGIGAAQSAAAVVRVSFAVTAAVSPVAVPPGARATLTVLVGAGATGTPVTLEQRLGTGAWRPLGHPLLKAGGRAVVSISSLGPVGTYTFRVTRAADASHEAGSGLAQTSVTTSGKGKAAWAAADGTTARPARWNPCAPIVYYVNPRKMPSTGMADLREALRRISMVNGLSFRYGGRRDVIATAGYRAPAGSFLVAWEGVAEARGAVYAYDAGRTWFVDDGHRIISGYVVINADYIGTGRSAPGFGATLSQGGLFMHELGHVVGLGHVSDAWAIMNPAGRLPAAVWGASDIAGLRAVGRQAGCL